MRAETMAIKQRKKINKNNQNNIRESGDDGSKLKWLWEQIKGYRAFYITCIFGAIVYSVMELTVAIFSQNIVDRFLTGKNAEYNLENHRDTFIWLVVGMIAVTFIRTVLVYIICMGFERVSQHVLYSVRNSLFHKIEHQDMLFYDKYRTGDLMTRVTGDLDGIRHMLAWVVRMFVECITLYVAAAVYFFYLDAQMAAAIVAITPMVFIITWRFKKAVGPKHDNLREQLSGMNTTAQENISGNKVVKAFAREDYEIDKFKACNKAYYNAKISTIFTWIRFFPLIESCVNIMPVVLIVYGGIKMMEGTFTSGEYVAFNCLIWAITSPMREIGNILNEFQRFSSACTKVMELEASEPVIVDKENAISHPDRFAGRIEYKNVSFAYGDKEVLTDISFTIEPGMTVAIMGETGSGKTSLINLLPRFYDPDHGQVLIDGIDVRDLKLRELRKNIGMATQDILLYSDTIDGNIAYGNTAMTEENVRNYARYSAASEFIEQLPEQYDTIVGERGVGLSGGQKQRISLARAMAIEPSILVLDDTTSAVDMETEKYIQQKLKELTFDCTKIIIAQRISSTKDADMILIIKDGRIIEQGTHRELVAKKGYYYDIYLLQDGGESIG